MSNNTTNTRSNRGRDYDDRDNHGHRDRDDRGDRYRDDHRDRNDHREDRRRRNNDDSRDPRDAPFDGRDYHSKKRRRDDGDNNYTGPRRGGVELNVLRDIRTALNFQNRLLQQLAMSGGVPEDNVQFSYRGNKTLDSNPPKNYSPSSSPISEDKDE